MKKSNDTPQQVITLGYDLDNWYGYGEKNPVTMDISPETNSHILLCGMSGSGKSYAEQEYIAKLFLSEYGAISSSGNEKIAKVSPEYWFADYKGDDTFAYLRGCPRYRSYKSSIEALDAVYSILIARISGEDTKRYPVTLFWDEYIAGVLALIAEDKKTAAVVMNKVSEILLLGRSMNVRITITCQRPDALAFPAGSRLNYGIVIILGAAVRSIYEMLMPDFIGEVKDRKFGRGEGVALLQGSELHFIKISTVRNYERMQQLCIEALS